MRSTVIWHKKSVSDPSEVPELLAALKQCHEAIDRLFAQLVVATSKGPRLFLPSQSGQPWAAAVAAHELIKRLEAE